jgi:hypothetical protein
MILNFEDFTEPLSEEEKTYIPIVIGAFDPDRHIPKTAWKIIDIINDRPSIIISEPRLKKLLSTIRRMGVLWSKAQLIANSKGYFWSEDSAEITAYNISLIQRELGTLALSISSTQIMANLGDENAIKNLPKLKLIENTLKELIP